MSPAALVVTRSLLGVVLVVLATTVGVRAQATATLRVSATVVAPHTMAPQVSAAELAESVTELTLAGERAELDQADVVKIEESGVQVSMNVVALRDVRVSAAGPRARVVHMTVAFSGN